MERITESTPASSDIVATATVLDGFMLSPIDQLSGRTSFKQGNQPKSSTTTTLMAQSANMKAKIYSSLEELKAQDTAMDMRNNKVGVDLGNLCSEKSCWTLCSDALYDKEFMANQREGYVF